MSEPIKIFELKKSDFLKGMSAHAGLPVGGIFQTATEFDPFSLPGYLRGSLAPVDVDTATITTQIKALVNAVSGGIGYVFAIGNRAGTGTKCFYRIKTSDNTVTDYSSGVATNEGTGAVTLGGMAVDNDGAQILYGEMKNGNVRRVSFGGSGDANILTLSSFNAAYPMVFFKGAEGYYYVTTGLTTGFVREFHGSGSSWTTGGAGYTIETGLIAKDGCTDGTYTIIIGDDNPTNVTGITGNCKVFFFQPGASTWDRVWTIPGQFIVSARFVNGVVRVIGASGIWECGIGMPPRRVMPLSSTKIPANALQVAVQNEVMFWTSTTSGARIYAYGNPFGGKAILYQPYASSSGTQLNVALTSAGDYLYAGLDGTGATTKVVAHNWGTTRNPVTIQTTAEALEMPHTFHMLKVVLKKPLATGESVTVSVFNANDEVITDQVTKTYTSLGAWRELLFGVTPASGSVSKFSDFYPSVSASGGAIIERISIFAIPSNDISQTK